MAVAKTVEELREILSNPDQIVEQALPIAQSLCVMASENADSPELQELVLRALENRQYFRHTEPILNGLVRTLGLFPYLDPKDLPIRDLLAYEFHRPKNMDDRYVVFHRVQAEVYTKLLNGPNVILSAPTSFGKSLIIDAIIATGRFRNVLIIVPTIALIDETRRRLSRFRHTYKLITHATQQPSNANIYVLTQERAVDLEAIQSVDFFVIDEFYKLQPDLDNQRGVTLNHALYKLLQREVQFYMLGPNIQGIPEGFARRFECTFIRTDYATVVSETHLLPSRHDRDAQLVDLCRSLDEPTLIYCASPARANRVVQLLLESHVTERQNTCQSAVEWLAREYHHDWLLTRGLEVGIGLHHGRVPRSIAEFMVRIFNEGLLKFLVCTSTLIEGVNTKAKNVVIFDNKIATKKFDYFTFNNIRGRSGRMFQHFVGHAYLFDSPPDRELPFVDIPMYTQDESVDDSLLIQLEESDLTDRARAQLEPILAQSSLRLEIIRDNVGISPSGQVSLAVEIESKPDYYDSVLGWYGNPTYEQLEGVCDLIWRHLLPRQGMLGGVASARQLAYKINQLRRYKRVKTLIAQEMSRGTSDPNRAVEGVLEFIRYWACFHFPRYLGALDRIQKAVSGRLGRRAGDYGVFGGEVENLFVDPTLLALEEYGVPLQVSLRIQHLLRPDGDLDGVLHRMRTLEIVGLDLDEFESQLLEDALADL